LLHYGATYIESQMCEGEEVVVLGGGNSAGQAAVFLAQTARRSVHGCASCRLGRIDVAISHSAHYGDPSIELLCSSELTGLAGENHLEEVRWINKQTGNMRFAPAHHIFIMTGASPNTRWLQGRLALDDKGLSSPDTICHWLLTQIGILLGCFRARL
jgi:thioredoxin reductase (NADPH)